ncbi:deoxyribonuclease IV [Fuchsiella alkaliacetigena]|uniref:deoxyribonuclease IV n=1 Tax=Fuchsiella alkaliacetigena TaxID=957042 RepID=UPI00200AE38E|nr:deoxyribonuclease IV [Fuchsiella alkaliacetigena]MCK8823497.1 deoxyribonuclease IV [Fuchsiella alkaliacetigena]
MKLGLHLSIAGGVDKAVDRAVELGADTLQIFAKSPRNWQGRQLKSAEIATFKTKLAEAEINPLIVHVNYLSNLATPKEELYRKSKAAISADLQRAELLGADYLVLHPGNHTGSGTEAGLARINQALEQLVAENETGVKLLLENVAGAGTELGVNFKELAAMVSGIPTAEIGLCLDTCHAFGAGYNLSTKEGIQRLLAEIDEDFALDRLEVVHINDSKGELGSNKDRHFHIGQGEIGYSGFKELLKLLPDSVKALILETPIDEAGDDELNLQTLQDLADEVI